MTRMKRRDSIAILADILSIIRLKGPIRKTRLMNYANLNPRTFNNYMVRLVNSGLVRVVEGRAYELTGRGALFLAIYNNLMKTFEEQPATVKSHTILDQVTAKLSSNSRLQLGYMLSSSSGTRFYYDIVVIRNGQPRLAIMDVTRSTALHRGVEAGTLLLSCIENRNVHHIVLASDDTTAYFTNLIRSLGGGHCSATIVPPVSASELAEIIEKQLSRSED